MKTVALAAKRTTVHTGLEALPVNEHTLLGT